MQQLRKRFFDNTMEEVIEIGSPFASKRVILLHGLTGTASVIRPVAEYLYRRLGESYSFILPTAPIIKVKQFNGEPVHAWFDVKSSDFRREVDVEGIFASSDRVASLIRKEISQGVSPEDIFLGGFSQGGVIALTSALLEPFAVAGVFALSSYLPLEDQLTSQMTDASKGVPIFQAVSLRDEFISQEMSDKAYEYLRKRGNPVLVKKYDMKHEIRNKELEDLIHWMRSIG